MSIFQHISSNFFVQKCFGQLFSSYSLALYFFGKRILAQKLLLKSWWNWLYSFKILPLTPLPWTQPYSNNINKGCWKVGSCTNYKCSTLRQQFLNWKLWHLQHYWLLLNYRFLIHSFEGNYQVVYVDSNIPQKRKKNCQK